MSGPPQYEPAIEVRRAEGRGQGSFATRKIAKHTPFLVDKALVTFGKDEGILQVTTRVAALPATEKATFDALAAVDPARIDPDDAMSGELRKMGVPEPTVLAARHTAAIFQANAFSVKPNASPTDLDATAPFFDPRLNQTLQRIIFAAVARINHSCAPNAHTHYNQAWGAMVVYALRDIDPGEEILISYWSIVRPRAWRQNRAETWGFSCECSVCLPGPAADEHEALLVEIQVAMKLGTSTMETAYASVPGHSSVDRAARKSVPKLKSAITSVKTKPHLTPMLPEMCNLLGTIQTVAPLNAASDRDAIRCFRDAFEYQSAITGANSKEAEKFRTALENRQRLQAQMDEEP